MGTDFISFKMMGLVPNTSKKAPCGDKMQVTEIHDSIQNLWISSDIRDDISSQKEVLVYWIGWITVTANYPP